VAKTPRFRPTASFWEANRIALDSLWKNKLRTFLTLLGIILATATLITVRTLTWLNHFSVRFCLAR
jgi:hypothetical protein